VWLNTDKQIAQELGIKASVIADQRSKLCDDLKSLRNLTRCHDRPEGDPGIGKSYAAMNLTAALSVGGTLPNGKRMKRKRALYLSAEDDPNYTIRPRIYG
jgi:hypothetical protein